MNQILDFLLYSNRRVRVIDQKTHAILDYATTAYFAGLAAYFWGKNRRAAAVAIINAAEVLGLSLFTDYPGGVVKAIPFETHGKIDLVQAASAAALPWLMGFGHKPQALPFHLQALNEVGVVDLTDWESGADAREERWRKAS
ncbi:MAG TPA: hypothetical protein VGG15_07820 [Terriglobales bacterium]